MRGKKTRLIPEASFQFSMNDHYKVLSLAYIPYSKKKKKKPIISLLQTDKFEKIKKSTKKSQDQLISQAAKIHSLAKFHRGCEISQGLRNFATLAKLLGLLPSSTLPHFFQFFIYKSDFNLNSL